MNQLDLFPTPETRCRTWQEIDRTRGLSREAKAWLGHRYTEHRLQEDAANMDEDLILPGVCASIEELRRQEQRKADYFAQKVRPWDVIECDPQYDPRFIRRKP